MGKIGQPGAIQCSPSMLQVPVPGPWQGALHACTLSFSFNPWGDGKDVHRVAEGCEQGAWAAYAPEEGSQECSAGQVCLNVTCPAVLRGRLCCGAEIPELTWGLVAVCHHSSARLRGGHLTLILSEKEGSRVVRCQERVPSIPLPASRRPTQV